MSAPEHPTTPNHSLPIPEYGTLEDQWGDVINTELTQQLEERLPLRDTAAARSEYEPYIDALYWDTDGDQYLHVGDGANWQRATLGLDALTVDNATDVGGTLTVGANVADGAGNTVYDQTNNHVPSDRVQTAGLDADTVDGWEGEDLAGVKDAAMLTSTDTTTNINQSTWTVIPWDRQLEVDAGYTHDPATTPGEVTFEEAGTYRVAVMLSFESVDMRTNPGIRFAINGTLRDGLGLSGYIRAGSGHNEASNYHEEFITVAAGDTLTVQSSQYGAAGVVTLLASESRLIIEQVGETTPLAGDADTVDGQHAAAFLLSAGDTMGGDLNMGTNSVTNVNLVDGVDVAGHAANVAAHHTRFSDDAADRLSDIPTRPHSDLTNVGASQHHERYADEEAQDAVGTILSADFAYDDVTPAITLAPHTGDADAHHAQNHDNADHTTNMVEDATTTGNAPYEVQKDGVDGVGVINFKTV